MESIEGIKERMRAAVDVDYYDSRYALQIWMSGYYDQCIASGGIDVLRDEPSGVNRYELPDYSTLQPAFEGAGLQNHGLVNSRINVQGVVASKAVYRFSVSDAMHRGVLESYLAQSWVDGGWQKHFYNAGMDVETSGIGIAVCGPADDGGVTWSHSPIMDTLFDRAYRMPSQWRWMAHRIRVPIDDALEEYGGFITKEKGQSAEDAMRAYSRKRPLPLGSSGYTQAGGLRTLMTGGENTNIQDDVVHCWHYWDGQHQCVFVGSVSGEEEASKSLTLTWTGSKYEPAEKAAKTPYPKVPVAYWIDSWAPGIDRPTAKSETTIRLASVLNEIEFMMVRAVRNSLPVPVIDGTKVSSELAENLRRIVADHGTFHLKSLGNLIVSEGGNINEIVQRLDPINLPVIWRELRAQLKDEINAATGVQDMQRGQALTGEKTKYEVQQLMDSAGIQARHMRNQYGEFLEGVAGVTFAVASVADTKGYALQLDDGEVQIGAGGFPLAPFLRGTIPCSVDPSSLVYKTDEDRKNEVLAELKGLLEPALQAGVANPYRMFVYLVKKWGHRDATAVLNTPEEMKQIQKSKEDAAKAGSHSALKELIAIKWELLPPDTKNAVLQLLGLPPSKMLGTGQPQQDPNQPAEQDHETRITAMKEAASTHRTVIKEDAATQREILKARMRPEPQVNKKSA